MLAKRLLVLQLAVGAVLYACGSPTPAPPVTPPPMVVPPTVVQGVQGTVVIGNAGEALGNARIEALDASGTVVASTQTDVNGQYSLNLPVGRYTVLSPGQTLTSTVNEGGLGPVAFASSQVVGVDVLAQTFTRLNLIQSPAAAGSNASAPPTISVANLNPTLDAGGTVEFDDDVTTGGGNSLTYLYASLGRDPVRNLLGRNNRKRLFLGGAAGEPSPTTELKQHDSLDLNVYAAGLSGDTNLYLTAIDTNHDRSVYAFPVTITNTPAGADLTSTVQNVNVNALTVANTRIQLQSAPRAAGNALVYTTLTWDPFTFPAVATGALDQGYHIYRALNDGPPTLVNTVGVYMTTDAKGKPTFVNTTAWQDTDPALAPGVKVSYTVRAFYGGHETADSVASAATVLPVLSVELTGPTDQASGVSTTPTFTWQTNGVGAYEYFVPVLSDSVNGVGVSGCGVLPVAQPSGDLLDLLQQSTVSSARGFGFSGTLCGVVGGPSTKSYGFDYHPGTTDFAPSGDLGSAPVVLPLQEARSYQWRLLEAVAVDDPVTTHAVSVAFDDVGLLYTYSPYVSLYTFDGDHVFTFTTGGTK